MGKVYEALNKAEMERRKPYLSGYDTRGEAGQAQAASAQRAKDFDFIDFSLSAPPAEEFERLQQEQDSASEARARLAQASREARLDLTRVDPHLVSFFDTEVRACEQYNKLAIALINGAAARPLKRVLIASAEHREGRTCVLLNLACALARAKKRVLVIDSDLRRPSVLRLLGVESEAGLAEAVLGGKAPGEAAMKILPYGFVVLPGRERVDNAAELLSSPALAGLLETFEPDYDFMLFDSPPLATSADSSLLVRLTDTTLLVIRSGKTSSGQIAKAIRPLDESSIFGVVLNRTA